MIARPQPNQPVDELWRTVAACVDFCNAIENMTVSLQDVEVRIWNSTTGVYDLGRATGQGRLLLVGTAPVLQIE